MSALDLQSQPMLATHVRMQTDPITAETVLLYPEGLLLLNETAREIVSRCDGEHRVADIAATLAEEYDAPADQLAAEIAACLRELLQRQLIVLRQ